ncbi:MAG TPA: TetR/AcrR family transcriptional regulator [Dokdonella sp.]|uniref:TetR/AcrR family transcriptional regulator n=1 Tax=Dokdonella sp. TaxID=2291710 RepID=UPI002D7F94E5|nr:TetR/AcrR family transcriptional regulator [Dokdonella sp.]HET9034289.1 TetR/AcrR family transcriptional regulator [Dokdonella sp.]
MNAAIVKPCGPGRPKDLGKRAAILEAAKCLFPEHGFDGTSMDAIAAQAGVSKLTVYSHFTDKETLFTEAVREKCSEQMPNTLFDVDTRGSLRDQLLAIAKAFFALATSEESIALHRLLTARAGESTKLAQRFWEAGPQTLQNEFAGFLQREVDAGQLEVNDIKRASSQFFCLLKGELHARQLCGCVEATASQDEIEQHLQASVDMFMRAYAPGNAAPR